MSRQRRRHRDVVNTEKMYIAERKACFNLGYYSARKRWRSIFKLNGYKPKDGYFWSFLYEVCWKYPEASELQLKYLRGKK